MRKNSATSKVPFRFKLYTETGGTGTNPSDVAPPVHENEANEIIEVVKSIDLEYLAFLLRRSISRQKTTDFVIFGSGHRDQQKKILKYLVCLRHGLDRDSDIQKRIKFGKINQLINLLGRDERWPEQHFTNKCDSTVACKCDGERRGCRRQRIMNVSLMKLQMLRNEQAMLKDKFEENYINVLEIPKRKQVVDSSGDEENKSLEEEVSIALLELENNKSEGENKSSNTDGDENTEEDESSPNDGDKGGIEDKRKSSDRDDTVKDIEEGDIKDVDEDDIKDIEEGDIKDVEEDNIKDVEEDNIKDIEEDNIKDIEEDNIKDIEGVIGNGEDGPIEDLLHHDDPAVERVPSQNYDNETDTIGSEMHADIKQTNDNPLLHSKLHTDTNDLSQHLEERPITPRNIGEIISLSSRGTSDIPSTREKSFSSDMNINKDIKPNKKVKVMTKKVIKPRLPEIQKVSSEKRTKVKKEKSKKNKVTNLKDIDVPKEVNKEEEEKAISVLNDLNTEKILSAKQKTDNTNIQQQFDYLEVDLGTQQSIYKLFLLFRRPSNRNTLIQSGDSRITRGTSLSHIDLSAETWIISSSEASYPDDEISERNNSYKRNIPSLPPISNNIIQSKSLTFILEYSSDCIVWSEYKHSSGTSQVFKENDGQLVFTLEKEIGARYLRIHSKDNRTIKNATLKVERKDSSQVDTEEKSVSKTSPRSRSISEQYSERESGSMRKLSTRSQSNSEHHSVSESVSPSPPSSEPLDVNEEELSNVDGVIPLITSRDTDHSPEDYSNKFDSDLVVNIKKDSHVSHSLPTKKKVSMMFPPIASTNSLISRQEISESAQLRRRKTQLLNRQRAATQKLEAMKNSSNILRKNGENVSDDDERTDDPRQSVHGYKDDGRHFLQKCCIISKEQREWFKFLFNMYEEEKNENEGRFDKNDNEDRFGTAMNGNGNEDHLYRNDNEYHFDKNEDEARSLPLSDALEAMNIANNSLVTDGMTNYILTVLSIIGVSIGQRIDLKTFMLLLAFSEKVLSLGDFFHHNLDHMDYANLLSCIIKAKRMYRLLLRDDDDCTIYIEDFLVELKAANIPKQRTFSLCNQRKTNIRFSRLFSIFSSIYIYAYYNY